MQCIVPLVVQSPAQAHMHAHTRQIGAAYGLVVPMVLIDAAYRLAVLIARRMALSKAG